MKIWLPVLFLLLVAPLSAQAQSTPATGPHWGLSIGAGLPEGGTINLVFRPASWVRVEAGGAYLLNIGFDAAVTVMPIQGPVSPVLTLEGGRFIPGQGTSLVSKLVGSSNAQAAQTLSDLDYDYASAQLGLEFGSATGFQFYIHGGLSYIYAVATNFQHNLQTSTNDTSLTAANPTIKAVVPSAKVGFLFYF